MRLLNDHTDEMWVLDDYCFLLSFLNNVFIIWLGFSTPKRNLYRYFCVRTRSSEMKNDMHTYISYACTQYKHLRECVKLVYIRYQYNQYF